MPDLWDIIGTYSAHAPGLAEEGPGLVEVAHDALGQAPEEMPDGVALEVLEVPARRGCREEPERPL